MGRPQTKRPPQNPMQPNIQMPTVNMNQRPPQQPVRSSGSFPRDVHFIKSHMADFQKLDEGRQREILGEMVFPMVREMSTMSEENVPKITGMLIDFDVFEVDEILEMIQQNDKMLEKIREAEEMLENKGEE